MPEPGGGIATEASSAEQQVAVQADDVQIPSGENQIEDESMLVDREMDVPVEAVVPVLSDSGPALSLEEVKAQMRPEIVEALRKHFNGEIVAVRKTDERDLIF